MFATAVELGVPPGDVGRLTLRQVGALSRHQTKRERERQTIGDYRAGVLASLLFNMNIDPEKTQPRGPDYWFPSLRGEKRPRTRRPSQRELFAKMEAIEKRARGLRRQA